MLLTWKKQKNNEVQMKAKEKREKKDKLSPTIPSPYLKGEVIEGKEKVKWLSIKEYR